MMKRLLNFLFAALFCLAVFAVPALFFLTPEQDFSPREKRYLAPRPVLSAASLLDGTYMEKLGDYVSDHFPRREFFVGLNAYYDLFSGRQSTKEYFPTRDGRLYARPVQYDPAVLDREMAAVNAFSRELAASGRDIPVTLMLVPSSGAVLLDEPRYPDAELIARAYEQAEVGHVDLLSVFQNHPAPGSLYYRTDHHWTSEGAFQAVCAYRRALGLPCTGREEYRLMRCGSFYGSAYAGSGLWLTQPDSLELWYSENVLRISNETGAVNDSVFYLDRLGQQDKYSVFLDGNHSLVRIENLSGGRGEGRRLLVIRDSFSNSLGCFLAGLYDRVVLVDLRYYKLPLTQLILDNEINEILIEYSVDNFLHDANLSFLTLDPDALCVEPEEPPVQKPPNYFAPPPAIQEEMFDGAYYLGDSVIWTLESYCKQSGKLRGASIGCNAKLCFHDIVSEFKGRLIYKGRYVTISELLEATGAKVLITELGVNDLANYGFESCQTAVLDYLEMVRAFDPDITIFLQSVMPIQTRMTNFNQGVVDEFNAWLRESAEEYDYCYIALDASFKGADGRLSDAYRYNDTHINGAGGSVWYRELMNIDNYHNFPARFCVEYDGETNLPVETAEEVEAEEVPEEAPPEQTLLDEIYAEICARVSCPQMLALSDSSVDHLGLSPADYRDGRFYLCANGLKADEIWLVESEDAASAEAMLAKARERIDMRARSFDKYLPEESAVARQGIALRQGNFVALFISPDAERMKQIFLTALG